MKKKKAVAYARFSSTQQREESIVRQIESIYEFCEKNNLLLVEKYVDEAQSGTNDNRNRFQDMIEDAQNSDWDFIVCYKMDRFSRSVADNMHYKKKLSKYGIRILSVIEDFDDSSPEGNLFGLMTMGLSQFYVENLKRESFAGIIQNAKRCMTTGGPPPFGFDINEDLEFLINEHEAEGVRLMFKMAAEDHSYAQIAREMNKRGYKTKFGNPFTAHIYDMLINPKYIGEYVYNRSAKKNIDGTRNSHKKKSEIDVIRIPGGIPRIVDDRTFHIVQRLIKSRRYKSFRRGPKTKYLLSGLITCSDCGKSISGMMGYGGRDKKPRLRYRCHGPSRVETCKTRDINAVYYEKFIWDIIDEILNYGNIKKLQELVNNQLMQLKDSFEARIDELNLSISNNNQIVKELTDRVSSFKSSTDKIINEQIGEYMDSIIESKNEKKYYLEDIEFIEPVIQSDLKKSIKKYKAMRKEKSSHKDLLMDLVKRIYQGNDLIVVKLRLNEFLPYQLFNDLIYEKSEIRNSIALKYNNKYIMPLFE